MSVLANRPYWKMNGLGNEIVVVDLRAAEGAVSAEDARRVAAAVPFDQMMVLHHGDGLDAYMRIYNADGSEVSSCGNGTRCVAWLLFEETQRRAIRLATSSGPLAATIEDQPFTVTVDMGTPRFDWDAIPLAHAVADTDAVAVPLPGEDLPPASVVNVGNPHAIFWVDDIAALDLARLGPLLERHALFPERANISLARITGADALTLKVWERGAGLTQACGTAACAAAVLAARTGRTGRRVTVTLPGGVLVIRWREDDSHILMTGPVEHEFHDVFDPALFAGSAA